MDKLRQQWTRAREWLHYAGLSREEYESIQAAVDQKNYNTLICTTMLAAAILAGLFLLSLALPALEKNTLLYSAFCGTFLLLFVLALLFVKRKKSRSCLLSYLMVFTAFLFGILLGTYKLPDAPATTFCVLIFALPLLIIDKPFRCSLILIAATTCFCVCSVYWKEPDIELQDLVNSISFLFLGLAVNFYVMRTKLRDLLNQNFIERERDMDDLTRVLNRAAGQRQISAYMRARSDTAALLMIDIDDFKHINDTYGHVYGDSVLRIVGECLRNSFRGADVLARVGGDEFVAFLPNVSGRAQIDLCLERLTKVVRERLAASGRFEAVTVSIGVAVFPEDSREYEELYDMADKALYASKFAGKNRINFYSALGAE